MNEVKGTSWKKPPIEIFRHGTYETRPKLATHLFLKFLMKTWQWPEDGVEIIPWKIIQEHLQNRRLPIQLAACFINGLYDLPYWQESVWSWRAPHVCHCYALWETLAVQLHNSIVSCRMGFAFNITFFCWKNKKAKINAISTVSTK